MVEVTRLELAASASRTQRSTKLSHTSRTNMAANAAIKSGCPTRIRTQTNRVRVCRATITQSGNVISHELYYTVPIKKVKPFSSIFKKKQPIILIKSGFGIIIFEAIILIKNNSLYLRYYKKTAPKQCSPRGASAAGFAFVRNYVVLLQPTP